MVENTFGSKDGRNISLTYTYGEMDCEGRWVQIVQGLFLQSSVSFTYKKYSNIILMRDVNYPLSGHIQFRILGRMSQNSFHFRNNFQSDKYS